jgi:predicted transcriptional regulator
MLVPCCRQNRLELILMIEMLKITVVAKKTTIIYFVNLNEFIFFLEIAI